MTGTDGTDTAAQGADRAQEGSVPGVVEPTPHPGADQQSDGVDGGPGVGEPTPAEGGDRVRERASAVTIDPGTLAGLEALLFIADEPLEMSALALALEVDEDHVLVHLDELAQRLEERQSGLTVRNVADGWRLYTDPTTDEVVQRHLLSGRQSRLSQAALETLAVVAYKQPVTRGDVSDIRGVNADAAMRSLVARGLLEEVGREDGPGQAVLFGTTTKFLEELGLVALDDLPELTDHLEGDAPDEPVGTDLRAARRALQAGHRLPSSGRGTWDGETVEEEPADLFARRRERQAAFSELTDDLEQVAEAAMVRLQEAVARAEAVDGDGRDEGRAGEDGGSDAPEARAGASS